MGFWAAVRGFFAGSPRPAPTTTSTRIPTPPGGIAIRAEVASEWARLKAFVAHCEAHRLDVRPLHADDCIGFLERRAAIDDAQARGMPLDRVAQEHGFADAKHWQTIVRYFEARHSELYVDASGARRIRFVEEYRRAQDLVAARAKQAESARVAEARMLEPIQGVDLERFALVSAAIVRLGPTPSRAELSRVLQQLGVGSATYGAVRRGWLDRIGKDPTRALQKRYMDAFLAARGKFETLLPDAQSEAAPASGTAVARRSWADVGVDQVA